MAWQCLGAAHVGGRELTNRLLHAPCAIMIRLSHAKRSARGKHNDVFAVPLVPPLPHSLIRPLIRRLEVLFRSNLNEL